MLSIKQTERAGIDLREILEYLQEHSPAAAQRFAAGLDQQCELLAQFPAMGRARDDLHPGLRSVVVEKYVVFYRVTQEAVEIIRILHGRRDIEQIMSEETQDE